MRNIGQSGLPSAVSVGVFAKASPADVQVGMATTTIPLLPSQAEDLTVTLAAAPAGSDTYYAKILIDPIASDVPRVPDGQRHEPSGHTRMRDGAEVGRSRRRLGFA